MTQATTATPQTAFFWDRIQRWARWARFGAWVLVALFFLILFAEAVRLCSLASGLHPLLGYATAGLLAVSALVVAIPAWRFLKVPRALRPPDIPAADALTAAHLVREMRFLDRYFRNCARNPEFADRVGEIASAREELRLLLRKSGAVPPAELGAELGNWSRTRAMSILAGVDERADRLIYQEALAVGVGTAVSPNGTLDAFVMLWRSVHLASRLAVMYYGRPGPLGTLAIVRDVAVAMVAAAYLDRFSDSLGNVLARTAGGAAGIVAGPAVEGVTNGLVLVRIGYLARERCRSFRAWDQNEQRSALLKALSATQRVALGLTTEVFRQVGSGLGVAAEAAAKGISRAAEAAARNISAAAGSAWNAATGFGQKMGSAFQGKRPEAPPDEAREG